MSAERVQTYRRISHNLLLLEEAARAVGALRRAGIEAIVLKGCAHLGDVVALDARPTGDVDLLVRRRDFRRAGAALRARGARRHAGSVRVFGRRLYHARSFVTPRGRVLDLHASLADPWRWPIDEDGLFRRAEAYDLAGREAYRLAPEDRIVHAALNQAKDDFYIDRRTAADFEGILEAGSVRAPRWEDVLARARQWRATIAVYLALENARRRRGLSIPEDVLAALRPPPWRLRALEAILDLDAARPYRFEGHPRRLRQLLVAPLSTDSPLYFPARTAAFVAVGTADAALLPAELARRGALRVRARRAGRGAAGGGG